ncbi:MAG: ABC transporter substrate-binding protein [Gammaproteobacteria bacterium]|nr:ABC transporter substrate-binding protein [Gammaproteobacteria bacterium]
MQSNLRLSIAMGDYDRTRALSDGVVQIDGVDPVFLRLTPEEMFFRSFRHVDFDVAELSLSTFTLRTSRGDNPYIGIPVFPSRAFRHTSIVVRNDRGIDQPADLKGRKLGTPEYQLSACVWARALLEDEYGVKPSDIDWVRGGLEQPDRVEKVRLALPEGIRLSSAPAGQTLSAMLDAGELDGIVSPRLPAGFGQPGSRLKWLFEDPMATATDYYRRTAVFPVMHLIGIRRELVAEHRWLPATLYKAFEQAKQHALQRLSDTSATKVTLPFVEEQLQAAISLMGRDYWSYGLTESNRQTLETFLRHHHNQGLSQRRVAVDELFHPAATELFKI